MSNTQFLSRRKNYVKSYLRHISSQSVWSITPTSCRCWHIRWHGDWRGHGGWGRIPFEVNGLFRSFAINGIIEIYRMQRFVPERNRANFGYFGHFWNRQFWYQNFLYKVMPTTAMRTRTPAATPMATPAKNPWLWSRPLGTFDLAEDVEGSLLRPSLGGLKDSVKKLREIN